MDRSALYERWLDDLELYLNTKREYDRKVRAGYEAGDHDADLPYWQEAEQLEHLREISRRALDEYVASAPPEEPPLTPSP